MKMAKTPLEHKDIVKMLGELKEQTPEYPVHMMSDRKAAFLQKAVAIKVSKGDGGSDKGGQKGGKTGSGGASGSGAALRNKSFFLGLTLKQTITIGVVLVMLIVGYFMREQITDVLAENNIINVEETAAPANGVSVVATPTHTPTPRFSLGGSAGDPEEEHTIVENPGSTAKVPEKETGPKVEAPDSERRGPASAFKFLFCILGLGGDNCE